MSEEEKRKDTDVIETADNAEKSTENKPEPLEASEQKESTEQTNSKSDLTALELAELAEVEASAAAARSKAAKAAAEHALEEEYKAAAKEAIASKISDSFTNKRFQEQIFRREMGEPEFWLQKHELAPPRPILTPEEEDEISRRVEIPTDQTPKYEPQHVLSPEYHGTSNYESGISSFKDELEEKLAKLRSDPNASPQQIHQTEEDLKTIDYLFENFNLGMNVFRTAKDGRKKIEK